jgi:ribonucleoside-triphosphate reductase
MPSQILKRDGRLKPGPAARPGHFQGPLCQRYKDPLLGRRLALKVEAKLKDVDIPEQEHVQDMVELVLMEMRQFALPASISSTARSAASSVSARGLL